MIPSEARNSARSVLLAKDLVRSLLFRPDAARSHRLDICSGDELTAAIVIRVGICLRDPCLN